MSLGHRLMLEGFWIIARGLTLLPRRMIMEYIGNLLKRFGGYGNQGRYGPSRAVIYQDSFLRQLLR